MFDPQVKPFQNNLGQTLSTTVTDLEKRQKTFLNFNTFLF